MTSWKEALVLLLKNCPDLVELCGERISHERSRQGDSLPRVTFYASGTDNGNSLDAGPDGLPLVRVQVDCWSRTGAEAEELARIVRRPVLSGGIAGYRGYVQDVFFQSLLFEDEGRDQFIPPQAGTDFGIHQVSLDLTLSYEEF